MSTNDDRWPSGPWTGYFLDARVPGMHRMDLELRFANGAVSGAGSDRIGRFTIEGTYENDGDEVRWSKQYTGAHRVAYRGFHEKKSIWGTWEAAPTLTGGFRIWPVGSSEAAEFVLSEAREAPAESSELVPVPIRRTTGR